MALDSNRYYKVLSPRFTPGYALRQYGGICTGCRKQAADDLSAGRLEELAARIANATTQDREHIVNGVIEAIFDEVRPRDPLHPSRLRTVHVFRDIESALTFRARWRPPSYRIYVVAHEGMYRHDSYMDWTNHTPVVPTGIDEAVRSLRNDAAEYWRGSRPTFTAPNQPLTESLLSPSVRVVEALNV